MKLVIAMRRSPASMADSPRATLKQFGPRSQIELQHPCATLLLMKNPICIGNRIDV
jgi:hypothetical protein